MSDIKGKNNIKDEGKKKKAKDEQEDKDTTGVTVGALRGLGRIIPGFGELVKDLEKSEAFRKRLKAVDEEVERQLENGSALSKVRGTTRSVIPTKTTLKASTATLKGKEGLLTGKEMIVDVFDEGDYLKVIAELPGIDKKDLRIGLKERSITLSAEAPGRSYYKEVELPCSVEKEWNLTYKNGILQVTIKKKRG